MTSIIKVDNLQNQCGANIINENAGTITIGASGDTVTLAAGASQSGFGRSGSVNWDTTPKTTGFTAVSGNGYFCDTTSAAFTVTLPATPSAGDIVAIADYNGTAATNPITIGRNSSDINGAAADFTISINYAAISFVYVDATAGWRSVDTSDTSSVIHPFITATGGTITTSGCGNYKIHTFTGPGTFTVTNAGTPAGSTTVDYLVIGGGGGGGSSVGDTVAAAGGGAGGYRESSGVASGCYSASPLGSGVSALPVSAQGYPIVVDGGGVGGTNSPTQATSGGVSTFSTITSAGGGRGSNGISSTPGSSGGSGGGGSWVRYTAGAGNTPPVSPPQGNNGGAPGSPPIQSGGGGGGASAVGQGNDGNNGGAGGAGVTSSINGTPTARAGGGGGGGGYPGTGNTGGSGGTGGGGTGGAVIESPLNHDGTAGTINTGSGGGGGGGEGNNSGCLSNSNGGNGGSGIIVIRYKFQ
jgi:hypothetical protein